MTGTTSVEEEREISVSVWDCFGVSQDLKEGREISAACSSWAVQCREGLVRAEEALNRLKNSDWGTPEQGSGKPASRKRG